MDLCSHGMFFCALSLTTGAGFGILAVLMVAMTLIQIGRDDDEGDDK